MDSSERRVMESVEMCVATRLVLKRLDFVGLFTQRIVKEWIDGHCQDVIGACTQLSLPSR